MRKLMIGQKVLWTRQIGGRNNSFGYGPDVPDYTDEDSYITAVFENRIECYSESFPIESLEDLGDCWQVKRGFTTY